jgi:hypothetical protein
MNEKTKAEPCAPQDLKLEFGLDYQCLTLVPSVSVRIAGGNCAWTGRIFLQCPEQETRWFPELGDDLPSDEYQTKCDPRIKAEALAYVQGVFTEMAEAISKFESAVNATQLGEKS